MRRAAAAALLAGLLVLAACGDGDDAAEAVRESSTDLTTTTTTPPAGATTTTAPPTTIRSSTSTTARPGATVTTATTVAGRRPLTPAAAGTYRYDTSGSSTFAGTSTPLPAVTTLVVSPPTGSTQGLTRNLRDSNGNGLTTEFALDYRPEGVFLVSVRLTVGVSGITETRNLRPSSPVLILSTGARPGDHVEADLVGPPAARMTVDVVGEERVAVAGQAVDTLVLRATITLAPGDVTGRQQLTVNVDRSSRLWVRERSVTEASAAGGLFTFRSEYTATLQRLTPS